MAAIWTGWLLWGDGTSGRQIRYRKYHCRAPPTAYELTKRTLSQFSRLRDRPELSRATAQRLETGRNDDRRTRQDHPDEGIERLVFSAHTQAVRA